MSKKKHLTKDFFVNASEEEARQHILQLPDNISSIKFVEENPVRHSFWFVYEWPIEAPEEYNYIEVSFLPLNVHQTRVTLHGSYTNGSLFENDFKIKNAFFNFESASHAIVKGAISEFVPRQMKIDNSRNLGIALGVAGVAGLFFLIKYWLI